MMIIYELHGLNDIAVDTAARFRAELSPRLDVDRAIQLLADPNCRKRTAAQRIRNWLLRQAKRVENYLGRNS